MSKEAPNVAYTAILRAVTPDRFVDMLAACSRQARETYFHRHDVKPPPASRLPRPGAKTEARALKLYEVLAREEDDEMAEEILRAWLLSKRPLLIAALDHLEIPHQQGLTDSEEIRKLEKLSAGDMRALAKALEGVAPRDEVCVYLKFMGAKDVDRALG